MPLIQQRAAYGTYPVYIQVGESMLVPREFGHQQVCGLNRSERDRQYPYSSVSSVGAITYEYPYACTRDKQFTHYTSQVKAPAIAPSSSCSPEIHVHRCELPGFGRECSCSNHIKKQPGSPLKNIQSPEVNGITSRECCSEGLQYLTDI
jgi:hypothetical protein